MGRGLREIVVGVILLRLLGDDVDPVPWAICCGDPGDGGTAMEAFDGTNRVGFRYSVPPAPTLPTVKFRSLEPRSVLGRGGGLLGSDVLRISLLSLALRTVLETVLGRRPTFR